MNVAFEWDPDKAARNLRKHRVSFEEARTVFADPLRRVEADDSHSRAEERWRIVGSSVRQRLLVVSFAESDDVTRIISARPATPRERRLHER
jgi:uncharacterized DUF497 family protein